MNLCEALRIHPRSRLALVGSGGKTTILFNLARETARPVILSTTTHLSTDELAQADRHSVIEDEEDIERAFSRPVEGVWLLTGAKTDTGNRVRGLADDLLALVKQRCDELNLPLLIEADGSRRRPLKAPGEHEPAIPAWVNQVSVVVGLTGLGKRLDEETVFRSERFAALCAAEKGAPITLDKLADYLLSSEGGLKNIPPDAACTVFFNQLDAQPLSVDIQQTYARRLLVGYDQVAWGAAANALQQQRVAARDEPVAGIILAAGGSSRFGRPKQLLEWRGQPFIRHVVLRCLNSGLQPVIVVVGEKAAEIRTAIADLAVQIAHNSEWSQGLSRSIRTGLAALPSRVGGALFLMSDVPQVPSALIERLMVVKRRAAVAILAPRTEEGYANPVLFDRVCFDDLMRLSGDRGGKALFQRYTVKDIPWANVQQLRDIDTPADYAWLQGWEG